MALHSITPACSLGSTSSQPIRIGVWLDQGEPPSWVGSTVEQLSATNNLVLTAALLGGGRRSRRKRHPLASCCWAIDRGLFLAKGDRPKYNVGSLPLQTIVMGDRHELSEFEFSQIKALDLDVILCLGSTLQRIQQVLDCVKHGVWFFESNVPQDNDDSDLVLSWYGKQRQPELALKALCPGGEIKTLYRSSLMGHNISLLRTQNAEGRARSSIVLRCLSHLREHGVPPVYDGHHQKSFPSNKPKLSVTKSTRSGLANTMRWLPRVTRGVIDRVLPPRWVIAYRDRSADQCFRLVVPPDGLNYADPFVFEDLGRHFVFFETWREGHKGVISCLKLGENEPTAVETVLERPYHLSYPYVFRWQDTIYMLPETAANGTIELYRAIDFPKRWELDTVLMNNTNAVDSTMLAHNDKLWLFTAGITGPELRTSELSLFYADSLHGPWIPHPKNPIVCDVHRARPAGALFCANGLLFRPGQDSSKHYGYSVRLSRVDALSESDYREIPTSVIRPDWAPGMVATHTLNQDSRFEVRDAQLSFRGLASASGHRNERKNSARY